MYKFIVYLFLIVALLFAYFDQLSNHASFIHYYKYKYAINRATHAAAMQLDDYALAEGRVIIDQNKAYDVAIKLLNMNIEQPNYSIRLFDVIQLGPNESPFHYKNANWGIDVIVYNPAVVMVVETSYNHFISSKSPYKWEIYGTSEVVTSFK